MKSLLAVFLSVTTLGSAVDGAPAAVKPNIIFILADDFGYECVGADGGTSYQTPHLDKLAADGMRFDRCYVQPLCTPSRAQFMTGLSNVRNYTQFGLLDPKAITFANLLKNAGYTTAIVGKWQLGGGFDQPHQFGFDEYCLWQLIRRPSRYANPGLEINGKAIDYTNGEYGPDLVSDYALDFVTRSKDRPFLLYYSMMLTHDPWQPTPDSPEWDPKATGDRSNAKYFPDNTAYMDKLIGKLTVRLDELGLRENTLILFTGDNGTGRRITSRLGTRTMNGGKGLTTSAGMHVPLIANWKGVITPGKVNQDLIDSTDFLPTFCAAALTEIPAQLKIDGRSFLPQLRGEKGTPREWIYCWYAPNQNGAQDEPKEFAATTRFKLYRTGNFFDYERDPDEQKPLDIESLDGVSASARQKLQEALDQYRQARPAELGIINR